MTQARDTKSSSRCSDNVEGVQRPRSEALFPLAGIAAASVRTRCIVVVKFVASSLGHRGIGGQLVSNSIGCPEDAPAIEIMRVRGIIGGIDDEQPIFRVEL